VDDPFFCINERSILDLPNGDGDDDGLDEVVLQRPLGATTAAVVTTETLGID
jgi:hypothetical protein